MLNTNMYSIKQFKEIIGQDAKTIISEGLNLIKKGSKYQCPNTTAHKHGDRNPSMAWDENRLQFHCFVCNENIDIYRYYRVYQNLSHLETIEKANNFEVENNYCTIKDETAISLSGYSELNDDLYAYLDKRGITKDTADIFNLMNDSGNIAIPFYDGSNNLTGVKIRNLGKGTAKYLALKGSYFGLFNKQNLVKDKPLIVCEGEFDCMIVSQIGFPNVVSVGTGANSLESLFNKEKDTFDKYESIILLSDRDESGENMRKLFVKRFDNKIKLPDMKLFKEMKDITELYMSHGEAQIKEVIESALTKIEGLRDLDIMPYTGISDLKNGSFIPTGLPSIDYALNDLNSGSLTLISGRSNGGKSTLVNQVIANAINEHYKVLLLNGEGHANLLLNSLYKVVVGNEKECYEEIKINKRVFKEPRKNVLAALQKWHSKKLTIFTKGDSNLKTIDELYQLAEYEIKTKGYNLVVIDNLMSFISIQKASEKYEIQADFVQRLCNLAKSYNTVIILVLHPTKDLKKGVEMDFEQISGSSDIYNKADNIIAVTRLYDEDIILEEANGKIEILKNRYFPNLAKIDTYFDPDTELLLELDKVNKIAHKYDFNWRKYLE